MVIQVCVGSSCHVKGSYYVKTRFEELVKEHNLEDKVQVQIAFCLGHCRNGVSIKIDDDLVLGLTRENTDEVFRERVLGNPAIV